MTNTWLVALLPKLRAQWCGEVRQAHRSLTWDMLEHFRKSVGSGIKRHIYFSANILKFMHARGLQKVPDKYKVWKSQVWISIFVLQPNKLNFKFHFPPTFWSPFSVWLSAWRTKHHPAGDTRNPQRMALWQQSWLMCLERTRQSHTWKKHMNKGR